MAIFIKLVLACFCIILGLGGYFITQDFLKTIGTQEYKNSSLFGRFITKVIWASVAASVLVLEVMIIISLFLKITVS
jgi:hypothetical protein